MHAPLRCTNRRARWGCNRDRSRLTGVGPAADSTQGPSFHSQIDENNVPAGVPRAHRLPYSRPLAERSSKARDQIMRGNQQQGSAEDVPEAAAQQELKMDAKQAGQRTEGAGVLVDPEQLKQLQQVQRVEFGAMPAPTLPPKLPQ